MTIEESLKRVFGHNEFRPGQREIVDILIAGRPALAVFPTGGGKSLCYQLPAIHLDGLTLVVSPLIALMRDQVEALLRCEVSAARLDSSLEQSEVAEIYQKMASGELKLLYVAPERLANEGFLQKLRETRISLIAVDEAHCISEWGHNFRPDYLKLGILTKELGVERVLALTATATPKVSEDIRRSFGIAEEDHIQTGFRRPNLQFQVTPCPAEERDDLLVSRLRDRPSGATIVYVTLQETAERVAGFLARADLNAKAYHAGLPDDYREEVQDAFMSGEVEIVVATIAFGMGIDKSDIRYVYHYNLPKSLENYVQETGRAGRDGKDSTCEILACADDRIVLENFVYGDTPTPQALRHLVEHVLLQGDEFSISRYDLSVTNDIRPLVIATALTNLELAGVITSTGPFYANYRFHFVESMERILAGHNAKRQAFLRKLFEVATGQRKWKTIEVDSASASIGESPDRIRQALNYLAELGEIVLQPSGLRNGYRLTPDHPENVTQITANLVELFAQREAGEISRLDLVLELCQTRHCLTQQLVTYFGEEMPEPCGNCGSCNAGLSDERQELPCSITDEVTLEHVELIREVIAEKKAALRHPRQLARFFCGITSPAGRRERLSRHDHFGALQHLPFLAVLTQVESMV